MFCTYTGNPYAGVLDDAVVQTYHDLNSGKYDPNAHKCGFPDKFVYKIVDEYMTTNSCSLAVVSLNRNKSLLKRK